MSGVTQTDKNNFWWWHVLWCINIKYLNRTRALSTQKCWNHLKNVVISHKISAILATSQLWSPDSCYWLQLSHDDHVTLSWWTFWWHKQSQSDLSQNHQRMSNMISLSTLTLTHDWTFPLFPVYCCDALQGRVDTHWTAGGGYQAAASCLQLSHAVMLPVTQYTDQRTMWWPTRENIYTNITVTYEINIYSSWTWWNVVEQGFMTGGLIWII